MKTKKTLMITGASGFVGSNFIKKYNDKYNIIPVSLRTTKIENIDFTDVDVILHLAALVHQMKGAPKEKYYEVNTELTRRLATKAKENVVKHFVFYSTIKVYGIDGDLHNHNFIIDENTSCNPKDPYGDSKYEAEKILNELKDNKFTVAIIIPPMVYGLGVKANMESLIKLVKKVSILPFSYNNKRSVVSVDNLLEFTDEAIMSPTSQIILPQDREPVSIKEIVNGISSALNKKVYLFKFPSVVFKVLCLIKPGLMTRLYGSLQYKINSQNKKSYFEEVKGSIKEN